MDLLLQFPKKRDIKTDFWKYLSLELFQYLIDLVRTVIRGDKIAKLIFSRPLPHPPGHREVGNAEYGGDDEGEECQ